MESNNPFTRLDGCSGLYSRDLYYSAGPDHGVLIYSYPGVRWTLLVIISVLLAPFVAELAGLVFLISALPAGWQVMKWLLVPSRLRGVNQQYGSMIVFKTPRANFCCPAENARSVNNPDAQLDAILAAVEESKELKHTQEGAWEQKWEKDDTLLSVRPKPSVRPKEKSEKENFWLDLCIAVFTKSEEQKEKERQFSYKLLRRRLNESFAVELAHGFKVPPKKASIHWAVIPVDWDTAIVVSNKCKVTSIDDVYLTVDSKKFYFSEVVGWSHSVGSKQVKRAASTSTSYVHISAPAGNGYLSLTLPKVKQTAERGSVPFFCQVSIDKKRWVNLSTSIDYGGMRNVYLNDFNALVEFLETYYWERANKSALLEEFNSAQDNLQKNEVIESWLESVKRDTAKNPSSSGSYEGMLAFIEDLREQIP